MTDLHDSPDLGATDTTSATSSATTVGESTVAPDELRRFRGSTVDEALIAARLELGDGLDVVEANRIRRGGLGGFFATDLGVEVIVAASNSSATSGTRAVDRILERFDGRDRFIPHDDVTSELDRPGLLDSVDPAPLRRSGRHPFADQLERELRAFDGADMSRPFGSGAVPIESSNGDRDVDDRPEKTPRSQAPADTPPLTTVPVEVQPSTERDERTDDDREDRADRPATEADPTAHDALADLDALLLRAGVAPPLTSHPTAPSTTPEASARLTNDAHNGDGDGDGDDDNDDATRDAVRDESEDESEDEQHLSTSLAVELPPAELLTAAADRLADQLANADAGGGINTRSLRKLKMKISSPDGTSVEMVAEWNECG